MNVAGNSDSPSGWTTSLGLMAGLRAEDSAAWERFTSLYSGLLDRWFRMDRIPVSEWADLRQEVFLAVAKGLPGFRQEPGKTSFRGWLRVIARRKWIDFLRTRFPVADSALLDELAEASIDEATAEQQLLFRRALELVQTDFNSDTWKAFWAMVIDGKTPAVTAKELGLTLNAVYLAKARVLRRLREEFSEFFDDSAPVQ